MISNFTTDISKTKMKHLLLVVVFGIAFSTSDAWYVLYVLETIIKALCTHQGFCLLLYLVTISSDFYLTLLGILIDTLARIPGLCVTDLHVDNI